MFRSVACLGLQQWAPDVLGNNLESMYNLLHEHIASVIYHYHPSSLSSPPDLHIPSTHFVKPSIPFPITSNVSSNPRTLSISLELTSRDLAPLRTFSKPFIPTRTSYASIGLDSVTFSTTSHPSSNSCYTIQGHFSRFCLGFPGRAYHQSFARHTDSNVM